jgi:hypothetical protein
MTHQETANNLEYYAFIHLVAKMTLLGNFICAKMYYFYNCVNVLEYDKYRAFNNAVHDYKHL